mmetsp:Transcript_846/g.2064  ORF Transcript_846/g.2064 Transcript_846/m.2064 type:complete len:108 (-) Transcript_846:2-325(-)
MSTSGHKRTPSRNGAGDAAASGGGTDCTAGRSVAPSSAGELLVVPAVEAGPKPPRRSCEYTDRARSKINRGFARATAEEARLERRDAMGEQSQVRRRGVVSADDQST